MKKKGVRIFDNYPNTPHDLPNAGLKYSLKTVLNYCTLLESNEVQVHQYEKRSTI